MPVLDDALKLSAELNFAVFPVHGVTPQGACTCGNPACGKLTGKHPATSNGLKAATTDTNIIHNLFTSSRPYNIGVATGAISGIFVLDVDGMEGEAALADLQGHFGPLPRTLTSLTGRGRHIIFQHPGQKVVNSTSKLGPKLDIRGDGGYFIAPPSLHQTGAYYQWDENQGWAIAPAPEWLLSLVRTQTPVPHTLDYEPSPDTKWAESDVLAMLAVLDPDMAYQEWITIGMALHAGGFPMAVFNNWSSKGSKYQSPRDIDFHWRSFRHSGGITMGTLVALAQTQGWHPVCAPNEALINIGREAAANIFTSIKLRSQSSQSTPLLIDFDNLPGLIGQTVQWILSHAQKPQPELALLNTLAALGAVFGRRYRSPLDTRTNIYTVGLAGTAAGKNHSKKCLKALMVEAALLPFLGGETIVSGTGLLTSVFKSPSQIMHLDEFGMLLEAIMDKRGASHMKVASKIITELYSNSSEKYYGAQYADSKRDPVVIANPNLCIFGISTLEKYTASLNREAIASGELNRFIIYKSSQDNPKRRRGVFADKPPEWLVKAWADLAPSTQQSGLLELTPFLVPWPGLQDRIDDMGDFEDEQIALNRHAAGALWGRYRENSIKVAMIFAIARNTISPSITAPDLDIAEALVRQSVDFMVDMVNEHLADSQHEKDCNDILQAIRAHDNTLTKTKLCNITRRMDAKQRDNSVKTLLDRGVIYIELEDTGGQRRTTHFKITP